MIFDTIIGPEEIEAKVTYTFSPGRDAKTYGPMEDCSEEEPPEIEIESVKVFVANIYASLSPEIKEQIEEEALNHAVDSAIDHAEKKADYERSQREEH